jgi:hypothetical protein
MKKTILLCSLLLPLSALAFTWQVGPSRTFAKPSDVALFVNNGDTVEIDAALYLGDVCVWTKNNLLLKGVGGRPHLRANGNNALGKGTWVAAGNNIHVDNIEFSESTVPDENGAGIRVDGVGLIVTNCYFHDNQNGILTGNNGGNIIIEQSEFGFNGFGDGQSHNIYIGSVDTAIIRFSYFHHANIGHELKSRARVNYISYNRFSNEAAGNASREIDLPSGGLSILIGNIIQQGPNSSNGNMVGYGLEGLVNAAPHEIYLINNTLVNERFAGSFLQSANATGFLKVYNNIFAGPGTVISYGGAASAVDSLTNKLVSDISQVGFINPAAYNYQLSSGSVAINSGSNPGAAHNGENLLPVFEYLHPTSFISRTAQGNIDAGSYELANVVPVNFLKFDAFVKWEQTILQWQTAEEISIRFYEVMLSANGTDFETATLLPPKYGVLNNYEWTDDTKINPAYYRIKITEQDGQYRFSKIVVVNKTRQNTIAPKAFFSGENLYLHNLPDNFKNTAAQLQIINAQGMLLFNHSIFLQARNNMVLNHSLFPAFNGYCIIIISNRDERIAIPVFVERK